MRIEINTFTLARLSPALEASDVFLISDRTEPPTAGNRLRNVVLVAAVKHLGMLASLVQAVRLTLSPRCSRERNFVWL